MPHRILWGFWLDRNWPSLEFDDAPADGGGDGLGPVRDAEFGEDAFEEMFHGGLRERERVHDLLVALAGGQTLEDFEFAPG